MNAIDRLMSEHRAIESVLSALEAYSARVVNGDDVPLDDAARFAEFFREYADKLHHGKEEDILFQSMTQHGFDTQTGPLAVMYHEHDAGRAHVRALGEAGSAEAWTADGRQSVARHAREFATLLRAHIQKEDGILYPMAASRLPEARMAAMADEFEAYDREDVGVGRQSELTALAEELAAAYA